MGIKVNGLVKTMHMVKAMQKRGMLKAGRVQSALEDLNGGKDQVPWEGKDRTWMVAFKMDFKSLSLVYQDCLAELLRHRLLNPTLNVFYLIGLNWGLKRSVSDNSHEIRILLFQRQHWENSCSRHCEEWRVLHPEKENEHIWKARNQRAL